MGAASGDVPAVLVLALVAVMVRASVIVNVAGRPSIVTAAVSERVVKRKSR